MLTLPTSALGDNGLLSRSRSLSLSLSLSLCAFVFAFFREGQGCIQNCNFALDPCFCWRSLLCSGIQSKNIHYHFAFLNAAQVFNPSPAEPRYTLSLQAVQI